LAPGNRRWLRSPCPCLRPRSRRAQSLRRRVDDDRAEPERPGESDRTFKRTRCLVRPNDTASSQLSVQRALGEEMFANPLHQFGEGGIGHRIQ
jgi:hypothetical protein